jgi:hypothetical protein
MYLERDFLILLRPTPEKKLQGHKSRLKNTKKIRQNRTEPSGRTLHF